MSEAKGMARFSINYECFKEILNLPDDVDIRAMQLNIERNEMCFLIEGDILPKVVPGEPIPKVTIQYDGETRPRRAEIVL